MLVNCHYFPQRIYYQASSSVSWLYTRCKQLAALIFKRIEHLAQQVFKSLKDYVWKWLNREGRLATFQLMRRSDSKKLPFGETRSLDVEVFAQYVLPHLSTKDLYNLLLTHTNYLKLIKRADVLERLFIDSEINHLKLASLVESAMKPVKNLNLQDSELHDAELLTLIQKLPNLEDLNLKGCQNMTGSVLHALGQNTRKLTSIDLSENEIEERDILALVRACPDLVNLNLADCKQIKRGFIQELLEARPKLVSLNLNGCKSIQESGVLAINQKFHHLKTLELGKCRLIKDKFILALAANCPNLEKINLNQSQITDKSLQQLAVSCPHLWRIKLARCDITDAGIQALAKKCSNLIKLNLYECSVTNIGIQALAQSCQNLAILYLWGPGNSDATIEALAQNCPQLRILYLSESNVTSQAIQILAENCHRLKNIYLRKCFNITILGIRLFIQKSPQLKKLKLIKSQLTEADIQLLASTYPNIVISD